MSACNSINKRKPDIWMGWEALELKIKNLTAGRLENSFFDKASSITKNVLGF